jgi:hypothetical protein
MDLLSRTCLYTGIIGTSQKSHCLLRTTYFAERDGLKGIVHPDGSA